jgi:hypothetical protein
MREADAIDIIGVNGDICRIQGPGIDAATWGPELAPGCTGLFDLAFKSNWTKGSFGSVYQSWVPQRRDIVFTVHLLNPVTGGDLEHDADQWHAIYSRWKALFDVELETTVAYTSVDGTRTLGVRLVDATKSFRAGQFEGIDPHVLLYGSVVMTVAAEIPFYIGDTDVYTWETSNTGDFWFGLPYFNPATFMSWPEWYLTDQAQWIVPDYSFGWQEYGRGQSDLGKTVPSPLLIAGENIHWTSRPDLEPIIADNENPVGNRMAGRALEYPIQPGMGDSDWGCTVRAINVTNPNGARCELYLPRWYNEPFSTPLLV